MSNFVRRANKVIESNWWYLIALIIIIVGLGLYIANQRFPQAQQRYAQMQQQWAEQAREAAEECDAAPGCNGANLDDLVAEHSVLLAQATVGGQQAPNRPASDNWFIAKGKLTPAGVATAFSAVVSIIVFAWLFTVIASRRRS